MGIGARSALWRRVLFLIFRSIYFRRKINFGKIVFKAYISPGSSLKLLDPRRLSIDRVHQRFIQDWVATDSVVWDIGANLGLFAIPAAIKASDGAVMGFEADVELVCNLLKSLRLPSNAKLKLSVFSLAISDTDGTAAFQISRYSRAMNKLLAVGSWHEEQVVTDELRYVATMRIDTLAQSLPPPSVMKIDVEGAELQVLQGAEGVIALHRPVILIEGPEELWDPMGKFFEKHKYIMLDGSVMNPVPLAHPVWDTIAVPAERYSRTVASADKRYEPKTGSVDVAITC